MSYPIPNIENLDEDLNQTILDISDTIDELNKRRDKGLSPQLESQLKDRIKVLHVFHSNAIEGSQLTLRETEIIVNNLSSKDEELSSTRGRIEATDLAKASDYLNKLITGGEALSSMSLRQLHELILKNTNNIEAGKYRTVNVEIKASNHVPPDSLHVEEEINKMFTWMNRNIHKYDPIVMGSILHHWITWIHPFSDGNGRVSRLFLNFFLLQKGYPEIIIKIDDRDKYYNSLESADNGTFEPLLNFIAQNIDNSVSIIERFMNENERKNQFIQEYANRGSELLKEQKIKHSYQYEVWKSFINTFKQLFKETVDDLDTVLPTIDLDCNLYEDLTLDQYLDLLELKPISKTWAIRLSIYNHSTKKRLTIVFYTKLFYKSTPLNLLGVQVKDINNPKKKLNKAYNRRVMLEISCRQGGERENKDLSKNIDLISVGTYKDELVFGLRNRKETFPMVVTDHSPAQDIINDFLSSVLSEYFDVQK